MHIPHILTHWTPEPLGGNKAKNVMTLNVYPDSNVLSRALADLLVDYSWKSFTVLYDTDEGKIPGLAIYGAVAHCTNDDDGDKRATGKSHFIQWRNYAAS